MTAFLSTHKLRTYLFVLKTKIQRHCCLSLLLKIFSVIQTAGPKMEALTFVFPPPLKC